MKLLGRTRIHMALASSTQGDTSKDVDITGTTPTDSISDLMFSPTHDLLAVASWDKKVYIYELGSSSANIKYIYDCEQPVLCVAWSTVCSISPSSRYVNTIADQPDRMAPK